MPTIHKSYLGITVSLANATAENLLTLIQAIEPDCPASVRQCIVQSNFGVLGENSGIIISIGDASVSATRAAYKLAAGDSRTYPSGGFQDIQLGSLYTYASGASSKLNVEIMV